MFKTAAWMAPLTLATLANHAAAANAEQVLGSAAKTLGADNLHSIEYSGSGYDFALGQAPNVKSPWPKFNDKSYTRTVNFDPWGGQNDQRSGAVIAEAKRLIPGKPVTELINTHAHFDHAGGVRAYVAEGATIITHESNKAYYQKVWANPHTIAPDRLSQQPRPAKFKLVSDRLTLTDGARVVEVYHLQNFGHNDGAIVAYLPKEKVLVEADAFNPPATPITQTPAVINPPTQSLDANIERLHLDVQRIIPIHLPADNRQVTLAELHKAIGKG